MTLVVLVLVGLLAAVAVHDAVRRPTLRRLAVRNVVRRRGEAALIVTGCLLGAAIVTSSILVGDSLRASVRDVARTDLGPVDEMVRVPPDRLEAAEAAVEGGRLPEGAGAVAAVRAPGVALTLAGPARAEPRLQVLELDFDAARGLGRDPAETGLAGAGATPARGEAVLEEGAASALGVGAGDRVRLLAVGGRVDLRVRAVVAGTGLAGLGDQGDEEVVNALVAPGTLARMARGAAPGAQPAEALLLIANGRGVFGGVALTDQVSRAVADALAPVAPAVVQPVKRDLVEVADEAGASFTAVFAAIGAVAVIAGVLLLVNVFVMLAEERKAQLGTLRALGLRRLGMVRAFGMEGALYALVGGALGALAGIGVARIIVSIADRIFASAGEDLSLRFAMPASSVGLGFAIGAGISLLTVWLTSARISRLNIIRAIRDQPAPPWRRSVRRIRVAGALLLAAGIAMTAAGVTGEAWVPALFGPVLVASGAACLIAGVVPARPAMAAGALVALAWGLVCPLVLPATFEAGGIQAFVAEGLVMSAAAIVLATAYSGMWLALARRAPRGGLPLRLGLAYPLARPFRTAMQMGMFALVVYGLVFMSLFTHLWQEQGPQYVRDIGAGHSVIVDSSPGNPVPPATLAAQPEVVSVAPLVRSLPEFSAPRHPDFERWYLTGFDDRLLAAGTPALGDRDPRYASDRAAFEAVLAAPDLAIVPVWFLQTGGGTPEGVADIGETIVMRDPASGRRRDLRIVGTIDADWALGGVMVSARTARDVLGTGAVQSRSMLALAPGADPDLTARALTGALASNGADAESVKAVVDRALSSNRSFMALSQGYVALGLVIGIGGLGVVMVRAVRERRRQIGMLRAMGLPSITIRRAFVIESAFVAARGLIIGGGLALVSCWLLVTQTDSMGAGVAFSVPWGTIGILLAAALAASLAATAVPAARAARIRPAVALRVSD